MPLEPQQGSYTRPLNGSIISTNNRTTQEVLVPILRVGSLFFGQFLSALLEGVRDVLEENEAQGHMFVFPWVHVAPHLIGSPPELLFKPQVGAIACLSVLSRGSGLCPSHGSSGGSLTRGQVTPNWLT